jgi:hypothetical protein
MYTKKKTIHYANFTKEGRLKIYKGKDLQGNKIEDYPDGISGKILNIMPYEYEYNNKKSWGWKVVFIHEDNGESVQCQLKVHKCAGYTRALFNLLCNADLMKELELTYWIKDDFLRIQIIQNGEGLNWKYSPDKIPKAKKIVTESGKEFNDDSEVEEWVKERVSEIKNNMGIKLVQPSITRQEDAFEGAVTVSEDLSDDTELDLPF